ncbi:uncharacterized protein LOC128963142 [Oppia nitens]|uniref:uncharacterized protein LOC128963142 n=1 Tax=Oppia nitens TaxID=1686743 RepID=UPI0023DC19D1|nr:uncharacterized protein LOC128963142 [Oppia nitens]
MSLLDGQTFFKSTVILIAILAIKVQLSQTKCPSRDYSWCLQIDGYDNVILDGNRFPDIKPVMGHISNLLDGNAKEGKRFDHFFLYNNHEVRRLEANSFADLTFNKINIKNCTKLIRIDPNAFNGTQHLITKVHIDLISISGPKNIEDFFDALNNLPKLEELELFNHNIIIIPSFAFRQPLLNRLELDGPLDTIKNNAFFDLVSLRILKLHKSVKHIPKHSFDFKTFTNKTLDIYFDIKFNTIESGIFSQVLRPITLNLYLKKLRDLSESVFKPILLSERRHDITFHGELKEMAQPCILKWLFDEKASFKGRFSFKTDPMIGPNDFVDCPEDSNSINDSQVNSSVNSFQPINSNPYSKLINRYLILAVGISIFLFNIQNQYV